jgi:hypothetical protein
MSTPTYKKHNPRLNAVAAIILAKTDAEKGITAQDLIDETGFSKPTIYRILAQPGFYKLRGAHYPPRYFFDPSLANLTSKIKLEPTGNSKREFPEAILTEPREKVFPALKSAEELNQHLGKALNELSNLFAMVDGFKQGTAKLDTTAVGETKEAIRKAEIVLEGYYQFLHRYKSIDTEDPTWWENI